MLGTLVVCRWMEFGAQGRERDGRGPTGRDAIWLHLSRFTALGYFALDGTDHPNDEAQGSLIRRYIIWRNKHAVDECLRDVVTRASLA